MNIKKRKTKLITITLVSLTLLISIISGAVFYASTKITPETLRELIVKGLNDSFPNAVSEVGDVKYSIGTTIKFDLNQLKLSLKDNKEKLLNLNHISLKIPVIAILFSG